ncbi:MAG: GNAT family N-acetyltransferase [Thermoleophilia bacterium]|nr:GNAT family N-acetyltransferase [Thermoleophilia bacterium]
MSAGLPPAGHEEPLRLVDGRSVAVRVVGGPDDGPLVAGLFDRLSPEAMAMRFGSARRGLSEAEVRRMSAAPGPEGLGFLALARGAGGDRAVALARMDREPDAPEGEFSVAVDDAWQGVGIGTGLLERVLAHAAGCGLDGLWAGVRPGNRRMLGVFRALGGDVREMAGHDEVLVRLPVVPDDELEEAEAARFARAAAASLDPMFRPRAIAVVGASRDPAKPGGAVFRAIRRSGFPGPVYPVNPAAASVDGVPTHPSVADLPEGVDLAVVAVPAERVIEVTRQAAGRGIRAMVVLTSGFREAGPEGRALEDRLLHVARTSGIRILGPNCLGLAVTDPARPFDATFGPASPPSGRMAFASQSGGLGVGALAYCAEHGLGLSAFASMGNKADLSSNDLIAWWDQDERTRVVLLYLEGFGNPRRFARLARRVARRTPIVALKAGRGAAGRRAAGSHTAALAAGDAPTDALFALAGVVRVDTVEELFDVGQLLAGQPVPAGPRIGIVSNAGGPGILAADACDALGLVVPALSPAAVDAVRAAHPTVAGPANPVDLGAGAGAAAMAGVGEALIASGEVDAVLAVFTLLAGGDAAEAARAVQSLADGRLCVAGCMLGAPVPVPPPGAEWPVAWSEFPEVAARALARAVEAGAVRHRAPDPAPPVPGVDRAAARAVLDQAEPGAWLPPAAVEALLAAYGIPFARARIARSAADAAAAQAAIGRPVAVKLLSSTVTHKSDVGGVVLGCASPAAAGMAWWTIEGRLAARRRQGEMEGVVVQEMAPAGLDLIVGAVADPVFGPLVLAGIGGVQAELWRDRALALAPVGPRAASALWDELRGAPLLDGYRGGPRADRAALADVVMRVARLAAEQPLLAELDLNPVRALAPGSGAVVVDARARRAP